MLRRLQIELVQKLGLGIIFSVVLVTIALDILRTYETYAGGAFGVFPSDALCTLLEVGFAVIVGCVPTYRALFGMKKRKTSSTSRLAPTSKTNASRQIEDGWGSEKATVDKDRLRTTKRDTFAMYGGEAGGLTPPLRPEC